MERVNKEELVKQLSADLKNAGVMVVSHYKGLTVSQLAKLRGEMRQAEGFIKVVKNSLARLAIADTDFAGIGDLFVGPTIMAYSHDPIAAPKIVKAFAKENENLVIIGGGFGSERLDAEGVNNLASLPSLDELRAKIVGMISTPATRLAQTVNAPSGQLVRVLAAYEQKQSAA